MKITSILQRNESKMVGDQLVISWISFHSLMKEIGIRIGVSRFESQTLILSFHDFFLHFVDFLSVSSSGPNGRWRSRQHLPLFFKGRVFFWGSGNLFSWWMVPKFWHRKWRFLLRSANLFRVKPQIDLLTWSISGKYVQVVWEKQNAWTVWLELCLLSLDNGFGCHIRLPKGYCL